MATIVEKSKIYPPPDTPLVFSLPMVFFDMIWYDFAADQTLLFFDFPGCSKTHFLDTIVPDLKASLSLTLRHFLPLAGNIIHPLNPADKPILRYQSGDSVCFTVCESSADFSQLAGNNPRNCDEFYALAPLLPPVTRSEKSISCPVLALQATLFPGKGLCIGFVTHHAVADASTVASFIQGWAFISRTRSDDPEPNLLPFYDRKTVTNLNGLDSIYWDLLVSLSCTQEPPPVKLPINKLRATFLLKKEEIQKLKNLVLAKCPGIVHLSSFTVVCALYWVCSAKSAGEEVADDEEEYFCFVADCRGRLKPPLPANYFGNCVSLVKTELKHGEVKGSDGFVKAAMAIGEAIRENVYNEEKGILYGAENWAEEYDKMTGKRVSSVAGSPRFDFYGADYGWGKPKKLEALFIDGGGSILLCKSRDFEGGLEVGVSKPKIEMDAFSRVWKQQSMSINPKAHAIMFPYPYQGHVTPMLNLSLQLASRGFIVTFVQLHFIHEAISKAHPTADFDIFAQARKSGLDIRYMTISDGFPAEFDRDLNYHQYWETMFLDFPPRVDEIVARIIGDEEPSSSFFLISDTIFSWLATPIAKKYNLVNISLWTEAAIAFSLNYHFDLLAQNGHFPYTGTDEILINYIPGVESISTKDLMSYVQDPDMIPMLTQVVVKGFEQIKEADFILCNTVEELEPGTLSALCSNHPIYAIGPINFYSNINIAKSLWSESDCTNWLDSKPSGSVLYVSFGSVAHSNREEIAKFADALVLTKVFFVWVLRPDITGDEKDSHILPSGFEDAVKDQGLIVPWCSQDKVLSSPATGGFLTHCGWNSVLESMWYGVPMICYPFLVDQPTNRKLVVDDWRIGINLCEGGEVTSEEIAEKINILMRGESSLEMKKEMKKVCKKMHDSVSYGGSSLRNLDQFEEDLKTRLYLGREKKSTVNRSK